MHRHHVAFALSLFASIGCEPATKPASSVITLSPPPSHATAAAPAPTVEGLYVEQDPQGDSLFIFSSGDRKWLMASGVMAPLEATASGGWVVRVSKDETALIDPSSQADSAWRIHGSGPRVYVQRRDAIDARLGIATGTFTRVDSRRFEDRAEMQRYMTVLRDANPDRFRQEIVGSVDPSVVAARGGVVGWVAEQLGSMLDDVRPFATDPASVDRDEAILQEVAKKRNAMWPQSHDAALLALVDLRRRSKDTIELRGSLALFHGRDKGDDCWLALLEPDPTDPLPSDARGSLVTRSFGALQASHGACAFDFDPMHMDGGAAGGVIFFVDSQGAIVGLQINGYEYSEVYLAQGRALDDAAAMMRAAADERARQAE